LQLANKEGLVSFQRCGWTAAKGNAKADTMLSFFTETSA